MKRSDKGPLFGGFDRFQGRLIIRMLRNFRYIFDIGDPTRFACDRFRTVSIESVMVDKVSASLPGNSIAL
ncbi:hypothetical protein CHM34_15180 [Paludifilum halophilum]|uniref:Uncharacterized protein n=1 Tax=Paludifilum halophilum TaxID=1642702 RepID=A0A235B410_9BACL|nr:hypothetical protein CHM34_15180 [Paludifilum halophilum]